ncbi:hypothetical protein GYMLUDRAFT_244159 [Collybiopsis luxurians FD-317 M1]|uniref:Uncharacterized protein n=1 Tax=Collybiopsis luxurians FD-317 M1 TaxID=944289 RepID=A0A0D0CDN4_9AGAR|nr:hypothetical protein GYMLUDRAFT_244159 [Collybiopsis luxurians FD-317 M1]
MDNSKEEGEDDEEKEQESQNNQLELTAMDIDSSFNKDYDLLAADNDNEPVIGVYTIGAKQYWLNPLSIWYPTSLTYTGVHPPTPILPPPSCASFTSQTVNAISPVPANKVSRKLAMLVEENLKGEESEATDSRKFSNLTDLQLCYLHVPLPPIVKPPPLPSSPLKPLQHLSKPPSIAIPP